MRRSTIVGSILLALALALAPGAAPAKGKPENTGKPGGKPAQAGGPQSPGGGPHVDDDDGGPGGPKGGPGGHPHVLREVKLQGGGPPPWAPAHGYRRKHGGGSEVAVYETPYGIGSGFCKRDAIAAAIGGVGGGILGGVLSDGDPVAIVGGMVGGALLGTILSKTGDPVDRGCFGQALEHGRSDQTVAWRNDKSGTSYRFVPQRTFESDGGRWCREYTNTIIDASGRERTERGTACRDADGTWN